VEAVTGEALPPGRPAASPLADAVVLLARSYRFEPTSAIARLAAAVNRGDAVGALTVADAAAADGVARRRGAALADLARAAADGYAAYLAAVRDGAPVDEAFAAFARFRILCTHRRGPWGVETVNALVEAHVRAAAGEGHEGWYPGRPVLVTRNDHALGLFNGDVGLALPEPDGPGRLRVAFQTDGGGVRRLAPSRLPAHEPVWATTVHKSQGSEFDRVLLVLPAEDSPLLTRELVYTAITRARAGVEIWGDDAILAAGVARRLVRSSGLRDALWGAEAAALVDGPSVD
jgi:exodeoxyribonuclease V alpha subunit